jgi:hypothetical protein
MRLTHALAIRLAALLALPASVLADPSSGQPSASARKAPVEEVVVRAAARAAGPRVAPTGANDYGVTAKDIANLPAGQATPVSGILAQLPGVSLDQNQQIHIRNTEGPQFQYNINGILVPFDINTNPPFLGMFGADFISRLDLLTGVLPARYSYATGGVVDIRTKDGCEAPGGRAAVTVGERDILQPSLDYGGCLGRFSYFVSAQFNHTDMGFSQATPGPTPVHDHADQGQLLGSFAYRLTDTARLGLLLSQSASNNQLPNIPGLAPAYTLAGAPPLNSAAITSSLNFRDTLGILSFKDSPTDDLSYQIAYAAHAISQKFLPDQAGELIYQGVASTASHSDADNTLQGDLSLRQGAQTVTTGFYFGAYHVVADDSSLVFPVNADGEQSSDLPVHRQNDAHAVNVLSGLYVNDLITLGGGVSINLGLRWDDLTGFTNANQVDPTASVIWRADPDTTLHAGAARYMQVPSFQGISPTAGAAFAGTTAAGPPGVATPETEDDIEFDAGATRRLAPGLTLSQDFYYEITRHYLDTGQFGVVPIFAPFNYGHGTIWGSETALNYRAGGLTTYANVTVGRNEQQGVVTGQFNFDPDELAFIDAHHIDLDHEPLLGIAAGASYKIGRYTLGAQATYSSGLRAGFADLEHLPAFMQIDASAQADFKIPGVGVVSDRITLWNIADRTNLIRPAEGIGIFQAAYGPRFTALDTVALSF